MPGSPGAAGRRENGMASDLPEPDNPPVAGDPAAETFTLQDAGTPAGGEGGETSWLGSLVLVPLGLVAAAVALYLFMTWMVGGGRGPEEYLQEAVSGGYNARQQAFFGLVAALLEAREDGTLDELPADLDERMAAAFDGLEPDDALGRVMLARSLVLLRSPLAFDRVAALVQDASGDRGSVAAATPLESMGIVETEHLNPLVHGLLMLGELGDPRGLPFLEPWLEDADAGLRIVATAAAGALDDPAVVPLLRERLEDADREVRRNAAVALARVGNPAGEGILLEMLDPGSYAGYRDGERVAETMLQALQALRALRSRRAVPVVRSLVEHQQDFAPAVASAAMRWLADAEAGWPGS